MTATIRSFAAVGDIVTDIIELDRAATAPLPSAAIVRALLAWYDRSRRDLPWRFAPGKPAEFPQSGTCVVYAQPSQFDETARSAGHITVSQRSDSDGTDAAANLGTGPPS